MVPRFLFVPWWVAGWSLIFYLKDGGGPGVWRLAVVGTAVSVLEIPVLAMTMRRYSEAARPWFVQAWGASAFLLGAPWVAWVVVRVLTAAS